MMLYDNRLSPLGPVQRALRTGYEIKMNELSTATLLLPTEDEQNADIQVPASFARIWDGDRDLGFFRFSGIPRAEHEPGGQTEYQLQSAECTLLDDLLVGWHEVGGTGYSTRRVMEYILARQTEKRWILGRCDFEDYYQYNFQDTTLLEALMSLGEVLLEDYLYIFDTTVTPWTVHLVAAPQQARRSLVYGRTARGISRSVDGRVVTRLYGRGYGEGDNQLTIKSVNGGLDYIEADAQTMARYGVRAGVHVDTRQTDPATLKARMQRILEAGKAPAVSYEADAIDLHRSSGEDWDDVRIGDKVLSLDEALGEPVTVRATSIRKDDVEADPGSVRYTLDNSAADTAEELNEILEKIGVHELYSQGATNMYSMQIADQADEGHPLEMKFYVPGNVLRINACLISWEIERFRTYATLAQSGGGGGHTSNEGGGATVSLPQTIVSNQFATGGSEVGPQGDTSGNTSSAIGGDGEIMSWTGYSDTLTSGRSSILTTGSSPSSLVTGSANGLSGEHSHRLTAHTHDMEHTHSVPSHRHNVTHIHNFKHMHHVSGSIVIPSMTFTLSPHSHTYSIPAHTHTLEYGVYEGSRASKISLVVDNAAVPDSALGSAREIDIAPYLRKNSDGKVTRGSFHTVRFVPDALTRITANLFFQVFIQSRGAGDY